VLAKTVDYEKDGNGIENPTHMAASGRPKVAERWVQIRASDQQARRQPRFPPERIYSDEQCKPANKPVERAEVQERRHQPSDRLGKLPRGELVNGPHHLALRNGTVNDRGRATHDPSYNQCGIMQIHCDLL